MFLPCFPQESSISSGSCQRRWLSVLTGQYIRIDNGAIQRAFYISFVLSLFSVSSFYPHIYFPPNRWMRWKFFARSRPRILFYPRLINAPTDSIFYWWFNLIALSSKKCQVGRPIESALTKTQELISILTSLILILIYDKDKWICRKQRCRTFFQYIPYNEITPRPSIILLQWDAAEACDGIKSW